MAIIVKNLTHADITRVVEIEELSFESHIRESKEVYHQRVETFEEGALGFFVEHRLIGFFFAELWEKQERYEKERFALSHNPSLFHTKGGNELYISSFAIDYHYKEVLKGRVAFSLAMNHLKERLSFSSVILLVSQRWQGALTIYKEWGFTTIETIENSLSLGEDAYVMRLVELC